VWVLPVDVCEKRSGLGLGVLIPFAVPSGKI